MVVFLTGCRAGTEVDTMCRCGIGLQRITSAFRRTELRPGAELRRSSGESLADVGCGERVFSGVGCAQADVSIRFRRWVRGHVRSQFDLGICEWQESCATISGI